MANKGQILVVDDNLASLKLLTDILKAEGYAVRSAINGYLALNSVSVQPPELILLDISMAGINGYEVYRRVNEQGPTRDTPVIFASALSDTLLRHNH